ncbi:hypothetical protein GF376_01965 [Candidatus Peregrinibacteria bacterium]|nr:hypothetical protein [Candidatus Peregrinibacteria bacterium]
MAKEKKIGKFVYYLFAPHLDPGEQIIDIVHRHPFILVKDFLKIVFFGFLLPIFFWYLFPEIWFVFMIWLMVGVIAINKLIFNWYFDALLITNASLIDVKWNGPFDRTSIRLEYAMIEGTTYAVQGFWRTVFNFGSIQINRQGGTVGVELPDAINPAKVESLILSYQEEFMSNKSLKDVNTLKSLLGSMISQHADKLNEIEVDY